MGHRVSAGGQVGVLAGGQVEVSAGGQVGVSAGGQVEVSAGGGVGVSAGGQVGVSAGGQVGMFPGGGVGVSAGGGVGVFPGGGVGVRTSVSIWSGGDPVEPCACVERVDRWLALEGKKRNTLSLPLPLHHCCPCACHTDHCQSSSGRDEPSLRPLLQA